MVHTILLVLKHLNFGGTERYALNLANSLTELGIKVIIVADHGPYESFISPKIKVIYAPIGRQSKNRRISEKIIADVVEKYKPQIIHAQCRNSLLCCQFARKLFQIPVISHEHMSYKDNEYDFVANELNTSCDRLITVGPHTARKIIRSGFQESKIETILNGVSLDDFSPITPQQRKDARMSLGLKKTDKVILCLSRIVPGKKIEELVEAFKQVLVQIPSAKLLIAGDDEWNTTKPALLEKIKRDNLSQHVLIYPAQYNIQRFHAVADIFCHPSISKGMAVMEAMASGLPIVARKSVKKPYVAEDNISGLLTTTSHPDELAKHLIMLLTNPLVAKKLGKEARRTINEKFNLITAVEKNLIAYSRVLTQKSALPVYPSVSPL